MYWVLAEMMSIWHSTFFYAFCSWLYYTIFDDDFFFHFILVVFFGFVAIMRKSKIKQFCVPFTATQNKDDRKMDNHREKKKCDKSPFEE